MHDSYESALALCVLFYFLRLLYVCSSPYSTRDTHYRLINILLLGYYCVSHIRITWLYQQLSKSRQTTISYILNRVDAYIYLLEKVTFSKAKAILLVYYTTLIAALFKES
jgi:hypothetical protein